MSESATTELLHPGLVRVRALANGGTPDPGDLAIINGRFAAQPLAADEVFVFDGIPSTDAVDSYWTHMDVATSLPNYRDDFQAGQSLLDSHDFYRLGIGLSFRAALEAIDGAEGQPATTQVRAGYYMLRKQHVGNEQNTDDYIRGILGGTYRKMSIGFGGPDMRYVCDIDGSDMWDWDSDYYPGQRLKDGRVVTYTVVNARAHETSIVYKNSTPGAVIQRVQALVDQRHIPPQEVARLEQAWGVRFPGRPQQFFTGERRMSGTPGQENAGRAVLDAVIRAGKTLSAATREKLSGVQGTLEEQAAVLAGLLEASDAAAEDGRALRAELGAQATVEDVRRLKHQAQAGDAYTRRLVDETVKAKIAVRGNDFDAERYRKRLERLDLDDIEDEYEDAVGKRGAAFRAGRQVPVPQQGKSGDAAETPTAFKIEEVE